MQFNLRIIGNFFVDCIFGSIFMWSVLDTGSSWKFASYSLYFMHSVFCGFCGHNHFNPWSGYSPSLGFICLVSGYRLPIYSRVNLCHGYDHSTLGNFIVTLTSSSFLANKFIWKNIFRVCNQLMDSPSLLCIWCVYWWIVYHWSVWYQQL